MLAFGVALIPALVAAELTFRIGTDHPDAVYACGEKAVFTVTAIVSNEVKATEGVVSAALDNFGTQQVATATFDLAKGNPFTVSGTLAEPGFLRLTLAGKGAKRTVQSVGYDPGRIRRGGPRPDDFDAWWDAQVAKLAREVPLDPQVERVPEESTKDFDFYRISFATFGRRVYGFMSVPTDRSKAPYPVRFTVPGAGWGSYSNVMRGDPDAISVFVGVHPFAPGGRGWDTPEMKAKYDAMNAEANAKWGTQYSQAGISASREEYFFYPVILGINRVVDWVAARDDVKASDFTYNGYSQGGGFGFYLTALNRHFTRAVMHVPALADTLGCLAGRASGWPTVIERQREENRAAALRNAPYFDAANFASRITIPVRVAVGFADTTCPPCAVYAAYNAIASKDKAIVHGNAMGHAAGRYRALHDAINAWLVEPPVRAPAPFAAGERVTFFGDSITTHNYFTYHLEFLETLRHPENPMLTISRGHAGDTAKGGFSRWDWDAAPVPSDRVVMMFGMNDVCRDAWKDELPDEQAAARREQALRTYEEYARKLADKILASGRRLTLVTPSPFDQYSRAEPPANLPFCNDPGLASCARIVRALAREKDLDVIDYFTPLTAFLQEHPEFGLLAKDRVHPDCKGGLLMAAIALEQMGVLPFTDETAFDAKGQPTAAFDYSPRHLPYPRTSDYLAVNAAHPLDGRLTREIVRIANLPDGTYELAGEGRPFGSFTAAELAAGVDLARLDTPSMRQAMAAAKAFGERRGHMQLSRRMVSTQVILRRMGVDVSDRAAVDAGIKKRRAEIARTVGGGRNPRMEKYYNGQLDFFVENRDREGEFDAENERLYRKLVDRCQPKGWKLTVAPRGAHSPSAR